MPFNRSQLLVFFGPLSLPTAKQFRQPYSCYFPHVITWHVAPPAGLLSASISPWSSAGWKSGQLHCSLAPGGHAPGHLPPVMASFLPGACWKIQGLTRRASDHSPLGGREVGGEHVSVCQVILNPYESEHLAPTSERGYFRQNPSPARLL